MELKNYQQDVLNDLAQYIRTLNSCNPSTAFARYWKGKGIDDAFDLHYHDTVTGVPNVTIKVPTAGGKTFIACNALRTIFDELPQHGFGQVVVWFVPSDTILTQTFANLSNNGHPYRQKLNALFNNRVCVVDKSMALSGNGISPSDISGQLTIFVLSVQSFIERVQRNHTDKSYLNDALAYRENGNLEGYIRQLEACYKKEINIASADESSLIRYIAMLNPVTIIDESHNFTSELRVDTLKNIHPSFIFDLTATPRENSNIISYVDAGRLKKENMVKLPVIVYNNHNKVDVLSNAIILRRQLEEKAHQMQQAGGSYVRPIVLFQAEPRTSDDTQTYEKIKKALLDSGIPEKEVKIKTADVNELKGIDLMSEDCSVRYIITVNALKEGWDCPFAYILATIANRTSKIDVEQIIGRILRQPYTKRFNDEMLNMSYVLTCGENFNETVEEVVRGLNHSGYSRRDYRKVEPVDMHKQLDERAQDAQKELFREQEQEAEPENEADDPADGLDIGRIKDAVSTPLSEQAPIDEINRLAQAQGDDYRQQLNKEPDDNLNIPLSMRNTPQYKIREEFEEAAAKLVLPNFCVPVNDNNLFSAAASELQAPVTRRYLLEGFELSKDKEISFDLNLEARSLDIENRGKEESSIVATNLNRFQQQALLSVMSAGNHEVKLSSITDNVCKMLSKDDEIGAEDLKDYVRAVLGSKSDTELLTMANILPSVADRFMVKIKRLKNDYAAQRFQDISDNGTLSVKPNYHFPKTISCTSQAIFPKGLYEVEDGNMDKFEKQVIEKIANLDNVLFWHRNPSRTGFKIDGYVNNHYPDFIVTTKKGQVVLVETKGRQLDNSDSQYKIEIGRKWDALAGQQYHYFMVFPDDDKDPLEGAMSESRMISLLQDM